MTIKLDLGPRNNPQIFRDFESMKQWLDNEIAEWQWVNEAKRRNPPVAPIVSHINSRWRSIKNKVQTLSANPEGAPSDDTIRGLVESTSEMFISGELLESQGAPAKFVFNLKERDVLHACYVLAHMLGVDVQVSTSAVIRGAIEAERFMQGQIPRDGYLTSSVEAMRNEWSRHFENDIETYGDTKNKIDQLLQEATESLQSRTDELDEVVKSGKENLSNLESTYDVKMALQKPVEYWQAQSIHHQSKSKTFGIWAGISAAGVSVFLSLGVYLILHDLKSGRPEIWQIGLLTVFATLGLWLIRVLVRILLSHLHLETDAEQRAVMTKTYLALMREGNALQEDDRTLVLNALFKPSSTGIVKDDSAPPSVFELLTRVGKS